jgi:hypothetical protein
VPKKKDEKETGDMSVSVGKEYMYINDRLKPIFPLFLP